MVRNLLAGLRRIDWRRWRLVWRLGVVAGIAGVTGPAGASPSGLNNTPTADTCPERTLVLQGWSGFARNDDSDYWTGFKYGLFKNAEIGVDWKVDDDPSRHAQLQAKYGIDVGEPWPRLALGVANISEHRTRNGKPMPYVALSHEFRGWFRAHIGYGFQDDNEGAFAGLDRTLKVFGRDLMLCGDVIQTNDQHDALWAPGFKLNLARERKEGERGTGGLTGALLGLLDHVVLETWVTFPSNGDPESYVAKLNIVVGF